MALEYYCGEHSLGNIAVLVLTLGDEGMIPVFIVQEEWILGLKSVLGAGKSVYLRGENQALGIEKIASGRIRSFPFFPFLFSL